MLVDWLLILILIQKVEKLKKKIPDFSRLVTSFVFKTKIKEIEDKIF